MKYYAGIGPRKVEKPIQDIATSIAKQLSPTGWCLRSGYARGMDQAFSRGAINQNIFLPWDGYNHGYVNGIDRAVRKITHDQIKIAANAYVMLNHEDIYEGNKPQWNQLKDTTKSLLCRNVPIILGENLDDPVKMVVTYLPTDYVGGTAHALWIAKEHNVPVFNYFHEQDQNDLCKFVLNHE